VNVAGGEDSLGTMHEVGDRVWAYVQDDGTWWVNNAGAVKGPDGVFIVDTCATQRRTSAFLNAVSRVAGTTPIRWAMNTHAHGDHTYGNSLLPAEVTLIGHAQMREQLLTDMIIEGCPPLWEPVPDWGDVVRRVPSLTFADSVTVHLGDRQVEVQHPGYPAHTTGDSVAWLPPERILFSGDLLFNGLTPLVFMGSVTGAIASLDWIAALQPLTVVPGHGPVIGEEDLPGVLDSHRRYYQMVIELAGRGMDSGLSPLDVARGADLGEFADWADSERLVPNLHRVYADREGHELDRVSALGDAVSWAGRRMQTSV